MINPLMKASIGELSSESQNALKTLQMELDSTKSLLELAESKLDRLDELGKDADKVALSVTSQQARLR